ncbi:MAG: cell wall hydrolase [Clostridia bacterium]|nr:cell wall hydrolase [Clostridia bacterium]MBQ8333402.1 cell wall hydrolase [Clostridia bacterium]
MKPIFRTILTSAAAAVLLCFSAIPSAAQNARITTTSGYRIIENGVNVTADGWDYDGVVYKVNNTAYVGLREFSCFADNSVVSWNEDALTATVTTDSLTVTAVENARSMEANGRILWCEFGIFRIDDALYVPLRQIAQAFGFDADYVSAENRTYLTRRRGAIVSGDDYYDTEELHWLARIIHAESQGEPFTGKLAVGNVILNRVDDPGFPDTIYGVIFDKRNGTQFTPTANGTIYNTPGEESVMAAKICLEDTRLSEEILYFLNRRIASSMWIVENCRFVMEIGGHSFYAP